MNSIGLGMGLLDLFDIFANFFALGLKGILLFPCSKEIKNRVLLLGLNIVGMLFAPPAPFRLLKSPVKFPEIKVD